MSCTDREDITMQNNIFLLFFSPCNYNVTKIMKSALLKIMWKN